MQITINGKSYELNFGIYFIKQMNIKHTVESGGVTQGMGVNQAVASLVMYDPVGLAEIIQSAAWINKEKPTQLDIMNFLDKEADIKKLCDSILKELESANATKAQVKNVLKTMKVAQQRAMKMSLEQSV